MVSLPLQFYKLVLKGRDQYGRDIWERTRAECLGMKDDLTDKMASSFEFSPIPFALKYIAYGQLSEVRPFLGRRAIENKAVMSGEGGAAAERKRLSGELWRRAFGGSHD